MNCFIEEIILYITIYTKCGSVMILVIWHMVESPGFFLRSFSIALVCESETEGGHQQ